MAKIIGHLVTHEHKSVFAALAKRLWPSGYPPGFGAAEFNNFRIGLALPSLRNFTKTAHCLGMDEAGLFNLLGLPDASVEACRQRLDAISRDKRLAKNERSKPWKIAYGRRKRRETAKPGTKGWVRMLGDPERAAWTKKRRAEYRRGPGWIKNTEWKRRQGIKARPVWKQLLKDLRRRVERCEVIWEKYSSPWRIAGYKSKKEWIDLCGSPEARELKRLDMQTKSASKRAKIRRTERNLQYNQSQFNAKDWYACMQSWGYRCAYCNRSRIECRADGFDLEMDHLLPIGHERFIHAVANIVPACKACNSSKADWDVIEWAASKSLSLSHRIISQYHTLRRALHAN